MEISNILTADVLDIIFDGKNKSYGAYELRKTYKRRLLLSIAGMLTVILIFVGTILLANSKKEQFVRQLELPPDVILDEVDKKKEEVKPPPPPKPPEPPKQIAQKMYTAPLITREATPDERPPENEALEDVKIGTKNLEGTVDDGTLGPPPNMSDGLGKGIIEAPAKKESDEPFLKVEVESKYPGGPEAWRRFLTKQLQNNYPQEAQDNEIQGTVVIQFIVDADGNVSNVEAISGPKELHEAAIKVIRKSGKWIPAIQNNRNVKSYKRQPIVFSLLVE